MGCELLKSSTSEAYQALGIYHIVSIGKINPITDFAYQRLKGLMIDFQYDEISTKPSSYTSVATGKQETVKEVQVCRYAMNP